jgi:hypothetical protein
MVHESYKPGQDTTTMSTIAIAFPNNDRAESVLVSRELV